MRPGAAHWLGLAFVLALGLPVAAETRRDHVRIAVAAPLRLFAEDLADRFTASGRFKYPLIMTARPGVLGFAFCTDDSSDAPDLALAEHPMTPEIIALCARNGLRDLAQQPVSGRGLIAMASPDMRVSDVDLAGFARRWDSGRAPRLSDIDPELDGTEIALVLPGSAPGHVLAALVPDLACAPDCAAAPGLATLGADPPEGPAILFASRETAAALEPSGWTQVALTRGDMPVAPVQPLFVWMRQTRITSVIGAAEAVALLQAGPPANAP